MNSTAASEETQLLGKQGRGGGSLHGYGQTFSRAVSFTFCCSFIIAQVLLEIVVLPRLLATTSVEAGLVIGIASPVISDKVADWIWILVANMFEPYVFEKLHGVPLEALDRDALRKCTSLVTVLRLCSTKLPIIIASLALALSRSLGIVLAIFSSLTLLSINVFIRLLLGQDKIVEDEWKLSVERTRSRNESDKSAYQQSQKGLTRSRVKRGLCDTFRSVIWALLLCCICYTTAKDLPVGLRAKLLKELLSADTNIDKLWKSCIPAKKLLTLVREVTTTDNRFQV